MGKKNTIGPVSDSMKKDENGASYWPDEDMHTLMRAAAIRKSPKRMADAKAAAKARLEKQKAETAQMQALARK